MRKSWQYLAMATALCGVGLTTVQAYQKDCRDSRITRSFKDEKLGDVLAWMSLGKYSFVCADTTYQERRLDISFQGATVDEAMEAIAAQTNGKWVQKDNIFTLYPEAVKPQRVVSPRKPVTFEGEMQPFVREGQGFFGNSGFVVQGTESGQNGFTFEFATAQRGDLSEMLAALPSRAEFRPTGWRLPTIEDLSELELSFVRQEPKPFEFDFFNTSPMREYPLLGDRMQDQDLERQLKSTLDQLQRTLSEISRSQGSKLTPEQSEKLQKSLDEIQAQLRLILSQKGRYTFGNELFQHKMDSSEFKRMMELQMKGLERMKLNLPKFQGGKLSPNQKMEVEKALKEAEKVRGEAFKQLDSDHMRKLMELEKLKLDRVKMDPKAKADFEKAIQEAMKHQKDAFKHFDSDQMRKLMEANPNEMDPKFKAQVEKALQEAMRSMELADKIKLQDYFKGSNFDRELKGLKDFKLGEVEHMHLFKSADLEKLMKSLTPKQKEIMKSKGHLTPADLTPDQRAMLGKLPEGSYTITFSKDGQSFTIKSGK